MDSYLIKVLLYVSFVLTLEGIYAKTNNGTEPTANIRGPRSNRRVVKLYSGPRPKPFVCKGEGFQGDPEDCSVFHRCMKSGNGRYLSFRFQCGPGTIFDPDAEICNHPNQVKRTICTHSNALTVEKIFENEISQELPSPINTVEVKKKSKENSTTENPKVTIPGHLWDSALMTTFAAIPTKLQNLYSTYVPPVQAYLSNSTQPARGHLIKIKPSFPKDITFNNRPTFYGEICTSDGFMGDSENCRKFYRCVGNNRGGFLRYEFVCSEQTIWDDDKKGCNHEWFVKKTRCGRKTFITDKVQDVSAVEFERKEGLISSGPTQSQSQTNYGSKATQSQSQINEDNITKQNQTQINYGSSDDTQQNQKQFSNGTAISQSQSQINYGDKGVQTQTQINHSKMTSQYQSQVINSNKKPDQEDSHASEMSAPVTQSSSHSSNNDCSENGFIGDKEDCKKFYRCVDNGKGSFTRYEFTCSDGTVWDSKIESCNHEWAVKSCGNKGSSESSSDTSHVFTTSSSTTTTTSNYYTSDEPTTDENEDMPYGSSPTPSTSSQPNIPITTESNIPQTSNSQCKSGGFMGDNKDCKKFYRCVDNGNGQFTRYEFACGQGTVWDSNIESCNHAWAVKNCGGDTDSTTHKQTQSTDDPFSEDYDTGYGQQEGSSTVIVINTSTTTVTTTTTTTTTTESLDKDNDVCKNSGFIGDSQDCKKFYRCVDNGNGGFTKYEFTCGEGTVWDQKIQSCNHAWAVEKCGESLNDTNYSETTTKEDIENSTTHKTTTEADKTDGGYDQETIRPPSSSTTQSVVNNSDNFCKSSGFFGYKTDCKKFYRCVDNGDGTFTRYEFSCGEGTVWDPDTATCNHPWSVKSCGDSEAHTETSSQNPLTTTTNQESDGEYPVLSDDNHEISSQTTTATSLSASTTSNEKCQSSGFMADEKDCKKFYRCVDDGQGGFTKYDFTCGEGTVWDSSIESCNHQWAVNKSCSESISSTTSNTMISTTHSSTTSSSDKPIDTVTNQQSTEQSQSKPSQDCTHQGFFGDPNDCKIFYRCVNDGKDGYIKYEFKCGEKTVWNQEIQACDHEMSNKQCNYQDSSTSSKKPEIDSDEMTTESFVSSSDKPNQETSTQQPVSNSDNCTADGFFANFKDCKKFYRCVQNGKGGFTKYDFSCGEGTIWVQEIQSCDHDNDITSCSNEKPKPEKPETTSSQTTLSSSDPQTQQPHENNTVEHTTKPKPTKMCHSEGFFGDENDCTKFYRCVDNGQGGYTKYEFECGEGTAWDSNIQTCNHMNEVASCSDSNEQNVESKPVMHDDEISQTPENSTEGNISNENSQPSQDKCEEEGYFGNSNDCSKFYRCVDDGKGGFTKYDFDCAEGTIWDQDLTTCNHPQDVSNPSCKNNDSSSASSESSTSSSPSSQETQSTGNNQNTSCSEDNNSGSKPNNENIKCEKEGYYANPDDCKKFYRCVDWDGNGEKFSVYHFECGEGTIWDPQLDTCNHEESVYPSRNCSGLQSQELPPETTTTENKEDSSTTETTTSTSTEKTTNSEQTTENSKEETTTKKSEEPSTTEKPDDQTTTEKTNEDTTTHKCDKETTTHKSDEQTTTEQTTTQKSEESTTTQKSIEDTTTQKSSQESTTQKSDDETTTSNSNEETTTKKPNEGTTTEKTDEQTTTEKSEEETTTQKSNEDTTTEQSKNETTTEESKEEPTTSQDSTTQQTTESNSEESTTATEKDDSTTTESNTDMEENSNKECPETDKDQYLYVCPTSFRRHPKYCNMFYQCIEDEENHEVKIATFTCPNNTIYDEDQTQCVDEDKASKKCDGQRARKYRIKRLQMYSREPIEVDQHSHKCSSIGYYPFEKNSDCSPVFLKCQMGKSGKLRGFVYQCPNDYVYWSISKRCERKKHMKYCQQINIKNWSNRVQIPVENKNIAK